MRRFSQLAPSLLTLFWAALLPAVAAAEVKLNSLFGDHMVLQRGRAVPVWGTSSDGEKITVAIAGQSHTATTKDGQWSVTLKALEAGGPHTLTVTGGNTIELKDVLVGEVWVAGGQSNMQWSVRQSANPEDVIKNSANSQLRLVTVKREGLPEPREEVVLSQPWVECGPMSVPEFSAVGYHFGSKLQAALKVPVGIINSNVGGTPADRWTSKEGYAASDSFKGRPSGDLYNAMIAPLTRFPVAGAIWYQGEANAGRAYQYRELFPTMIQSWRMAWGQPDMPFLFVQLAPFQKIVDQPQEASWAELREAQLMTLRLPKTGMAVITDVGEENNIHPKQKGPVGERLALAARAIAYGEDLVYSGPIYDSMQVRGKEVVLRFQHVDGGLVAKGDKLTGFTIASEDRQFHNAQARIEGDTVVVSSPAVEKPVAVRFGWAQFPVVNLWNKEGLPASPFRTDDFPVTTQPKPAGQ